MLDGLEPYPDDALALVRAACAVPEDDAYPPAPLP